MWKKATDKTTSIFRSIVPSTAIREHWVVVWAWTTSAVSGDALKSLQRCAWRPHDGHFNTTIRSLFSLQIDFETCWGVQWFSQTNYSVVRRVAKPGTHIPGYEPRDAGIIFRMQNRQCGTNAISYSRIGSNEVQSRLLTVLCEIIAFVLCHQKVLASLLKNPCWKRL